MIDNIALFRYGSKSNEIECRYNYQDLHRHTLDSYYRRDLTPKQLKRIRKQRNKWRKRIYDRQSKFNDINPLMGVSDKEPFYG